MTFYVIPCRWARGAQKEPPTNLRRQLCDILAPTNIRRHRVKFSRPCAMDLCALVISCSWPTVITYVTETSTTALETCSTSFFKVCCSISRLTDAYVFYTFSRELHLLIVVGCLYISCCFRSGCSRLFIELLMHLYCPHMCCIVRFESAHLSVFVTPVYMSGIAL